LLERNKAGDVLVKARSPRKKWAASQYGETGQKRGQSLKALVHKTIECEKPGLNKGGGGDLIPLKAPGQEKSKKNLTDALRGGKTYHHMKTSTLEKE